MFSLLYRILNWAIGLLVLKLLALVLYLNDSWINCVAATFTFREAFSLSLSSSPFLFALQNGVEISSVSVDRSPVEATLPSRDDRPTSSMDASFDRIFYFGLKVADNGAPADPRDQRTERAE